MRGIYQNVLHAIGDTPLVQLNKIVGRHDARVLAKLEFMNPGGSVKDRMALHIIEEAERTGALKPGSVIVENTSPPTRASDPGPDPWEVVDELVDEEDFSQALS